MILALCVAGGVAEATAWTLVARGRVGVWGSLAVVLAAAGVAALGTGKVALSPRIAPPLAAGAGVGAGLVLFASTRIFVAVVAPVWPAFRRHVAAIYGRRGGWSVGATLLAALVVEVGEELFWRGLVQGRLSTAQGRLLGASFAWMAYVGANVPSLSLPIVAGALVGGAVWGALTLWTGGILACLLCHAVWTELMIALPPRAARPRKPGLTAPAP
jgi:membrane protease YdiL (CAAX protease family)